MVRVKLFVDRFGYEHIEVEDIDFKVRYSKWGKTALWTVFDKIREKTNINI